MYEISARDSVCDRLITGVFSLKRGKPDRTAFLNNDPEDLSRSVESSIEIASENPAKAKIKISDRKYADRRTRIDRFSRGHIRDR